MAVSHLTELVGRVLAGRYELLAPLGSGASAQVFLAEDVRLRRRVAVKVLHPALADDPSFLKRFQAEAQAAAALNHPNLVAVYDWGTDSGLPFIVTEVLQGGSLRGALERNGRLTVSQTLVVGLEVARGLHYAHSRQFVHRDIKPANLLFGEDRRLRVADFGLARALSGAAWTEPEGVVLGTAKYASPEQASGAVLDGRSDIYSLALVLVECITGAVPHAGETALATLGSRVGRAIEATPDLGALGPLLEQAGRADPAERWTAAQLGRAFMGVAAELAPPEPIVLAGPRWPDRAAIDAGRSDATHFGSPTPTRPDTVAATAPVPVSPSRREQRAVARHQRRRRVARWSGVGLVGLAALVLAILALSIRGILISPPSYLVDSYLGRDAAQAETELAAPPARWNVSVEATRRDGTLAGQVIDQVPPAGTRLRRGGALMLTKSDGEDLRRVPGGVVNVPIADATAVVTAAGLSVGATEAAPSETVPAGIVLAVKGGEGELAKGTAVVLVVSGGPQRRTLPSFAGQSPDAAKTKLTDVGLTYEIAEQYSESVAKGLVLSTEPAAGEQLDRGGSVVIVVSLGRKAITIPDLANRSPADAATALQDLGLVPEQDGLANRPVIATDPPAGDRVYRGDKVRVISRRN